MSQTDRLDVRLIHPSIGLAGRVLFSLIFFVSGITHFTNVDGYVALIPVIIPYREFWVISSAVVELVGATLILLNFMPRLGGWLIVLFLVPVTIAVQGAGMMNAEDARMAQIQASFFLKGCTMTGAALLITQLGVGPATANSRQRPTEMEDE